MVVVDIPVQFDNAHYAAAAAGSHEMHTVDVVACTLEAPVPVLAVRTILSCLSRADYCDFGCDCTADCYHCIYHYHCAVYPVHHLQY